MVTEKIEELSIIVIKSAIEEKGRSIIIKSIARLGYRCRLINLI